MFYLSNNYYRLATTEQVLSVMNGNNSTYKGKSILVDFDYDNKTDIALPKLRIGSAKEQILTIDIDLKLARPIACAALPLYRATVTIAVNNTAAVIPNERYFCIKLCIAQNSIQEFYMNALSGFVSSG